MKLRFLIILIIVTLGLLYWQARLPLWNAHLQVDVWVWYTRLTSFFQQNSFANLKDNELLPATLFYNFLPAIFSGWSKLNYSHYLLTVIWLNLLILFSYFYFSRNRWSFLILVLCFGPISLFRFDTFAAFLVILGLIFWQKNRFSLAGVALGLATGIKLYPLIFLPYLGLLLLVRRQFRSLKIFLVFYLIALLLPVLAFLSFGGHVNQIADALSFHKNKYVSIESLPASILTAASIIKFNAPPPLLAGYGVWGIAAPLNFFNKFWLLPIVIFYLFLIKNKQYLNKINFGIIFCLILIFLIFSKNLNPQYIWWFVSLFPFLKFNPFIFILLIFINIFNQLVYPLYYTQFLKGFYQQNLYYAPFYCLLMRNFLIVLLATFSLWSVLVKRNIRT